MAIFMICTTHLSVSPGFLGGAAGRLDQLGEHSHAARTRLSAMWLGNKLGLHPWQSSGAEWHG